MTISQEILLLRVFSNTISFLRCLERRGLLTAEYYFIAEFLVASVAAIECYDLRTENPLKVEEVRK